MLVSLLSVAAMAFEQNQGEVSMSAMGSFVVKLEPQHDEIALAGRMTISKEYTGDLVGTGKGQMLSKRTEGVSVYSAVEEFEGEVKGKRGSFTLFHNGLMYSSKQELKVIIVEGSGSGELKTIRGELTIIQENGKHNYKLEYNL